jgi:uncharacterized membrane protein
MATPASVKRHPIHPMLVPLPIGLWIFALVGDVLTHLTGGAEWRTVAFYSIGGGIVGALLAAVPGLIDLWSMSSGPTRRIGIWHMSLNLLAVAVFALDFVVRWRAFDHSGPLLLTGLGIVIIGISGWLGGEMVYVGGVGVTGPQENQPPGPRTP